jgi:hypothetical protein
MYNAQAGYGMAQNTGNTSGQGAAAVVPPELQGGLNWGAFFLSWIWGLGNGVMIALLALIIPFFNFYLLFKGNELAWRNKQWGSVQDFQATQRKWAIAGLALIGISIAFACIMMVFSAVLAGSASS